MTTAMYPMKPVFELDAAIETPNCMYSLPVIQCSNNIAGVGASSPAPTALKALEARQDAILTRLEKLKSEVAAYKKSLGFSDAEMGTQVSVSVPGKTPDIVVRCSPSHPAHSLRAVTNLLLGAGLGVHTSCHTHSSVTCLPAQCQSFLPETQLSRSAAQVRITLIWKEVGRDAELMVSPLSQTLIKSEVNILRYLARLFPSIFLYESLSNVSSVNTMLDSVASLTWVPAKERQPVMRSLVTNLAKSPYLAGAKLSIVDLALYSTIRQLAMEKELQPELAKWYAKLGADLRDKTGGSMSSSSPVKNSKNKKEEKKGKSPVKEVKQQKKPE